MELLGEDFLEAYKKKYKRVLLDFAGNPVSLPVVGDLIGKVRIQSILGSGSMGVVFLGREVDLEVLRAVKVAIPDSSNKDFERMKTEAKVCAKLGHPNIVKVHNAGYWMDVLPFAEMEYIDGTDLSKIIKEENGVPAPFAMAVLSILCSALEYAHSQTITLGGVTFDNLVHRDLKPANVLISKKGIVKLTDFGLAKFEKMTDASVCGLILGTVPYMAPEHQKYGNVSIESDIYSLGVMFYEMLTGNRPFPEGDAVELDKYIQLKERATYEPLKKLLPGIDSNVARIVDKCLSPDKKDRYDSYTLLQLALDSALKNYTETRKDDIVSLFLDNKTNFEAIIGAKPRKRDSLKLSLKSFRIGIVAAVIIGMVVVISGFVFKKVNTPVKKDVPTILSDKPISLSYDSQKTVHNDSVVAVVKLPEPPKVNSQAEKPASINKITTKSVQNNDSVALPTEELTPLEIATDLFRKGDFDAASDILKKIDYSTQTDSQRDRGIVLLMESLFKGENYREAIRIANFYPVQDGKYFMILAFCQESMGMFNQAQTSFDKAINSSFFDRQSQRDAYLLRARFYQRRYEELRVEQLKTQMVQAWKEFLTSQCGSDSPECDEARNIVGL